MGRAASSGKMGVNTMAAGCSANNLVKATTKTNKVQKEKESGRTVNVSNGRTDEAGGELDKIFNTIIIYDCNFNQRSY